MGATHRKKKSNNGKSKYDFSKARTASPVPSSSIDKMDSSEDSQTEGDDVQLERIQLNPKHQNKLPEKPKKPPTSYNFFVNDIKVKIARKNPGINPMEFSSLAGKMFRALSEKKKQKYVELARVAREEYKKQVQKFKEAYPDQKFHEPDAFPNKKPLSSYNFFVNDNKVEIRKNNPEMSPMEIASLSGKMFKALSEKKKQKYVELARVAREKYQKQVKELEEAYNPTPNLVEIPENDGPLAPTPFSIFCTIMKKQRKSLSWCEKKFPSLPAKGKLKYIDLALAQEANYLEEFEKFKAENPHLKPKLNPVLNEEEKLFVYMRDAMPVKPPSTAFYLFASEYPAIPENKDGNREMRMAQWSASWNSLSKEERRVYQIRVTAMKQDYDTKWSTYLTNFPNEKRQEEIQDATGIKRKKRTEADECSASSKKLKPALNDDTGSESSEGEEEEEEPSTPLKIGSKKNATQAKGSDNKSCSTAIDSSDESDNSDDVTLTNKKQISFPNSTKESSEESTEESDFEPEPTNPPKKTVPKFAATEIPHASSSSSKSGKKMVRSVTERSAIQSEDDTSDEDESDKSVEKEESSRLNKKSSAMAGSSKLKNGLPLTKKSTLKRPLKTTTTINSSDESDSDDDKKLSFYLPKLPIEKRRKAVLKCVPGAKGMKRKKGAETNKSKPEFVDENDSDVESDDVIPPEKKQISPHQSSGDSSEVSSDESDAEPKQSILPRKRSSMVDTTKFAASNSIKKAKFSIVNPSSRSDLNGSDPSSPSSSDDEPQEMTRSSSSSFKSGKKLPSSVTKRNAIQSDQDTSEEYDSSEEEDKSSGLNDLSSTMTGSKAINGKSSLNSLPKTSDAVDTSDDFDSDDTVGESLSKKKQVAPKSAVKSSDESSDQEQSSLTKKSVSILTANPSSSLRKKDSSSSVRPLWASQQKLFKNEPPKPPKAAAEWHAFKNCKVSNISEKKKKDLWNGLSEKRRKKLKIEHTKRLEEYEERLQAFKKGLSKKELQAYEQFKRSQSAASVIE